MRRTWCGPEPRSSFAKAGRLHGRRVPSKGRGLDGPGAAGPGAAVSRQERADARSASETLRGVQSSKQTKEIPAARPPMRARGIVTRMGWDAAQLQASSGPGRPAPRARSRRAEACAGGRDAPIAATAKRPPRDIVGRDAILSAGK